jgi:integrase
LPKSEDLHFDAMPFEQMPAFIATLRERQQRSVAAVALEVTILTACRTGEVLGMRWSELDLPNQVWTIPAHRMKAGREHRVPLSVRVVELIKRQNTSSAYVFVGQTRDKPLDGSSMRLVLQNLVRGVTVHGFRSSFSDWAGDTTDFKEVNIEECLAHAGGPMRRAYRRGSAFDKRRKIMAEWAAYLG